MKRVKNKYILIAIVFAVSFLTQAAYAQKTQTMLQKENLKGKVKSVRVTNERDFYIKVWFDKTGKISKKEESRVDMIVIWDNYIYDEKGRLISISVYSEDNPTEKSEVTYKYLNDSVRESYNGTDKYDERGNCILEIRQRGQGYEHLERIYNQNNQLVEAFSHNGLERLNIWKTDSDGKRAYEVTEWVEPMKRNHVFFEYNKFGDVSLITLKTENGYTMLNKTGTMIYNGYDSAGNWLEQIRPGDLSRGDYDIKNNYRMYHEMYDTYLDGFHITRVIEYYE
ncbi:hypothetical protein M2451_003590 [Dysgonomonas sp. PFB1-18]|uniref:hypothetical protein n=1 Tax=unclassified Dysgonomonas TaxID=2630389 RepID=UPI0024732109|nr:MULTISPECIES: hypothetical protein [unclassified Dysgonomonas]MDH6310794.1 hypothetical protein [Dysgonomonas sp. PF1-14]MDH6340644.1 hypothetical protein [Dysgonomonas sp. PF1-16]MDH6382249.1 hypothetical protein [Dysgonomonas sp. PFB1-18]MDH6399614.1 hypothetical protein [Dysgonomonas sp. PF1-23]